MVEKISVFGDFPSKIFRVFDTEAYGREMVDHGRMRFGLLDVYTEQELGMRTDASEGIGAIRSSEPITSVAYDVATGRELRNEIDLGEMHRTYVNGNAVYILSFSSPPSSLHTDAPAHFGDHIVVVNEPEHLGSDIAGHLESINPCFSNSIQCAKVLYNKGELVKVPPEAWTLSFTQKPSAYAQEFEYRFILVSNLSPKEKPYPKYFHVDLRRRLPYLELLSR